METGYTFAASRHDLIYREAIAAIFVTILLLLSAILLPVEENAGKEGAALIGSYSAPWLVIWLQRLLRFLPIWLAGIAIPGVATGLLILLPWLPGSRDSRAVTIHLALILFLVCILAVLTLTGP